MDVTDTSGRLTIIGAGAGATIIDAGGEDGLLDRVFDVHGGAAAFFNGLTITGGWVAVEEVDGGGGIRNLGGHVEVTATTVTNNEVIGVGWQNGGGGILTVGGDNGGAPPSTLFVIDSTISNNVVTHGDGGGICSFNDHVMLMRSTVSGNQANGIGRGGGIYTEAQAMLSTLEVTDSTISDNTTTTDGGGIFNLGDTVTITNSTISGNTADGHGGGIVEMGGYSPYTTNLRFSTVANNTADQDNDGTGDGGGVFNMGGTVNFSTGGTATTADNDYTATATGSITIQIGAASAVVQIDPTVDSKVELDETVALTVTAGAGYTVGTPASATATITNDDSAALSIDNVAQVETDSGQTAFEFTVTLSEQVDTTVSLEADTADGTATTADSDFAPLDDHPISFAPAAVPGSQTQTVTAQANGDDKVELDEAFDVLLSNLSAGGRDVTISDATGQGTIENDDYAPAADAGGPYTISEGDSLNLDASATTDADSTTIIYRWDLDGDGDYDENVMGERPTLTWADLVALGINDGPDGPRNVTVEASDGTNTHTDTTTLTVNNAAPAVTVDEATVTVNEGQTTGNVGSYVEAGLDAVTVTASVGTISPSNRAELTLLHTLSVDYHQYNAGLAASGTDLFAYDVWGSDNIVRYAPDFSWTNLFPDIIPQTNSGGGDLAASPSDTLIWGVKSHDGPHSGLSGPPSHLFQFTADGTTFTDLGYVLRGSTHLDLDALAIDSADRLYAYEIQTGGSQLVRIDPATQQVTNIGSVLAGRTIRGAAFTDLGRLLVLDASADQLLRIDPTNGQIIGTPWDLYEGDSQFDLSDVSDIARRLDGSLVLMNGLQFYQLNIKDWSWSFDTTDGPSQSQTVTITATDSEGAASQTTFGLVVNNVAPTPSLAGPVTGAPAQPYTFSFSASDPSSVDEAAGFDYEIEWDDSSPNFTASGTPAGGSTTHFFTNFGTYDVGLTAEDKDNGVGPDTLSVTLAQATSVTINADVFSANVDNDIRVIRSGDNVVVTVDSLTVLDTPMAPLTVGLIINGQTGDDSLIVDFGGGDLTTPFEFNGGDPTSGSGDSLTLTGGTGFASLTYDMTGAGAGKLTFDGSSGINFTGLEPILVVPTAATVTINIDPLNVNPGVTTEFTSAGAGATKVSATGVAFEEMTFANPTEQLIVNGDPMDADNIKLTSLGSGFDATVTIEGQGGADTVTLDTVFTLGSAASTGDVSIAAETINLNAGP